MSLDLLYFGNPMCSWCWGFAPVLTSLRNECQDQIRINLGLGSLRQDTNPMSAQQKDYVRNHWEHVTAKSGQPFDFSFFERDDFCYDDRSPAAAVAALRTLNADQALDLFHAFQAAFYRDNRDITDPAVRTSLLEGLGIDAPSILAAAQSYDIAAEYEHTARLGVSGYPTLLAVAEGKAELLSLGYSDWPTVRARLMPLLDA